MGATVRKDEGDPDEIREIKEGNGDKYEQSMLRVYIKCHSPVDFTVSQLKDVKEGIKGGQWQYFSQN